MTKAAPTAPHWHTLAGEYQLRPGATPGVLGQRPVLGDGRLGQLLHGQRGDAVVRSLGSIFTLCAHAHQRAAGLALAAAQGTPLETAGAPVALWLETARDHLRSMALDWPQRLPQAGAHAPDLQWLRDCPLPLVASNASADTAAALTQLRQLRDWLEHRILGRPVSQWLQDCAAPEAFADWCQRQGARLPPARFLGAWYPLASRQQLPAHCLHLLHPDAALQHRNLTELAHAMERQSGFVQHPVWRGQCFENGPWTRLRHGPQPEGVPRSAWWRLSARWLELLSLAEAASSPSANGDVPAASAASRSAASHAPPMLGTGAIRLAQGQALGWCEMARGLLLHWVQLDEAGGVLDYRVLAPTEWNFHPQGALAQAVAALAPNDRTTATMLAAAFDPCVSCSVFDATVAP